MAVRVGRKMNFVLGLLLPVATIALAALPEAIQRVTLDERVVVTVPASTHRVTTIRFPGPVATIDAVCVTADGKTPGQFQLAHPKGSSFVSVRALTRKAATNLNIRWNKRSLSQGGAANRPVGRITGHWERLPLNQRRAPGEAAAKNHQQDQFAALNPTGVHRLVQRDGD